jgi:flavin reductase (DIM6/NTAB) family NADH-FMN oxidoreductase RutF
MQLEEKEKVGLALGRIPSGLFIVTFKNLELNEPDGMLMSWIQQASFEPPMVSVASKKDRKALELISKAGYFVVNVMGKQNAKIIGSFYKGVGGSKFEGINTLFSSKSNTPILADAVSYLECQVKEIHDTGGDHSVILGEVLSGSLLNAEQNESSVHLRKNGFDY